MQKHSIYVERLQKVIETKFDTAQYAFGQPSPDRSTVVHLTM